MRRLYPVFIIALVLVGALGYVVVKGSSPEDNNPAPIDQNKPPSNIADTDPIWDQINKMSRAAKIGQLVMAGVDGYQIDDNARQLIDKYQVGGYILLKQNIKNAGQMLALINSLKKANSGNNIPLFLAIDEEGGRISRLPAEFKKIPTNKRIGMINNSQLSYQVGGILGEELKIFGLNMDFAPVLDINSNPKNPVIGDRAFGTEAGVVTKLGLPTMKGIQSQNIISVVKHFPGHGDTAVDSHVGLPRVDNDLKRLTSFELQPFAEAVKNKVDGIMIAHILLPKIDPDNPASFSQTIISDILRKNMNYDGVVITDDLTMGAIIDNYDIGEAAVKSINAGTDIVLVCHGFDKEEQVIKAITQAAATGVISPERINQSVYRILKLKQEYALSNEQVRSADPQIINKKIDVLLKSYPALQG